MTHREYLNAIISHLTLVIEHAPAAKKDPEQLKDLLLSSSEFRVAARMLRDLPAYASSDEAEDAKVDSPLDEQVSLTRKILTETREHFRLIDTSGFEDRHLVALETMLGGVVEMSNNIQQLAAA